MNQQLYRRFDEPVNRVNTECIKWDNRKGFGNADALPMWVADMDFRTADGIVEALTARAAHGVFGYCQDSERDRLAVVNWMKTRHHTDVSPEWVLYSPGVVDSMYHILRGLYKEGARIVIQPPVYGPFRAMIEKARMTCVENPLVHDEAGWHMDYEGLEDCLRAGADAIMVCSPHNPVGRVWTRAELETLASLCAKYHTRVICDEIHGDFELSGAVHTPILSIPGAEDAVMMISATKTFNLAALRHSTILCADEGARKAIAASLSEAMAETNLFGRLATRVAYETGAEWLDALLAYLSDGRDLLEKGLSEIPGLKPSHVEGTYLMWVDARELGMDNEKLQRFFIDDCGVIPNDGLAFGERGRGFVRLNFATTHANLREALRRIGEAVEKR